MTRYEIVGDEVELYFDGKPSYGTRTEMKALRIWWNPDKMCWHGKNRPEVLALAKKLCGAEEDEPLKSVETPRVSTIPSGNTQDDKDYRINSYRVLLTRGRDGFVVFIPPVADMDIIEKVFKDVGVRKLENY